MDTIVLKDQAAERLTGLREIINLTSLMSPVTTLSSYSSGAAFAELANWTKRNGRGLAFDSSTGFTLLDQSIFTADACWLSRKKWNALSPEDKDSYAPVCPDFIIEVRSKNDDMNELRKKIERWIKNGAQLAWLIDPREEACFIFEPDKIENRINGFNQILKGEGPVEGFILDLSLLKI